MYFPNIYVHTISGPLYSYEIFHFKQGFQQAYISIQNTCVNWYIILLKTVSLATSKVQCHKLFTSCNIEGLVKLEKYSEEFFFLICTTNNISENYFGTFNICRSCIDPAIHNTNGHSTTHCKKRLPGKFHVPCFGCRQYLKRKNHAHCKWRCN